MRFNFGLIHVLGGVKNIQLCVKIIFPKRVIFDSISQKYQSASCCNMIKLSDEVLSIYFKKLSTNWSTEVINIQNGLPLIIVRIK